MPFHTLGLWVDVSTHITVPICPALTERNSKTKRGLLFMANEKKKKARKASSALMKRSLYVKQPRGHFTANAVYNAEGFWRKDCFLRGGGGGEPGSPDPKGRINSNSAAAKGGREVSKLSPSLPSRFCLPDCRVQIYQRGLHVFRGYLETTSSGILLIPWGI